MFQGLDSEEDTGQEEKIGEGVIDCVNQRCMSEKSCREQRVEILWRFNSLSLFYEAHEYLAHEWGYCHADEHSTGNDSKDSLCTFTAFEKYGSEEEGKTDHDKVIYIEPW